MKNLLFVFCISVAVPALAKEPPPFDLAADPATLAASFLKVDKLKGLADVKRIAISCFRIEFVVENKAGKGSSSSAGFSSARSDIKLLGVTDEARQRVVDQLYQELVRDLTGAGLDVIPYETLREDKEYKAIAKSLKTTQEPLGIQGGKSVFVAPSGMPFYFTGDDKHLSLGTALSSMSTAHPHVYEPRMAKSLDAAVMRVSIDVQFADMKASGGMFRTFSSVKTQSQLAFVPKMSQYLIITPKSGKVRITVDKTIAIAAADVLEMRDVTTTGEKAVQAAANVVTGLLAGGVRSQRHYEATTTPDAYATAIGQYGSALQSAVMSLMRSGLPAPASA